MQTDDLHRDLDKLEQSLNRAQALIDKKQNQIDLKQREKSDAQSSVGVDKDTPLEGKVDRCRAEIAAVTEFCNEAKSKWLKSQQEVIQRTEGVAQLRARLNDETRRFLIMSEKRKKMEVDIEALEMTVANVKRRIETKDNAVKRMSKQYHDDQQRSARIKLCL